MSESAIKQITIELTDGTQAAYTPGQMAAAFTRSGQDYPKHLELLAWITSMEAGK